MLQQRKYPVGIQDFEKLRTNGCVYVDKTDLVYQMAQKDYIFLSRPRRFGKSLLSSTLKYYFQGRKDLFQGLAIESLEKEWKTYPVLHFDLSTAKNRDLEGIKRELISQLRPYVEEYGVVPVEEEAAGQRLASLIKHIRKQRECKVVVIIDEYDAPMLDVLHEEEKLAEVRKVMQEFYAPLKACDADLRFVFITGITKFSQLSILSSSAESVSPPKCEPLKIGSYKKKSKTFSDTIKGGHFNNDRPLYIIRYKTYFFILNTKVPPFRMSSWVM